MIARDPGRESSATHGSNSNLQGRGRYPEAAARHISLLDGDTTRVRSGRLRSVLTGRQGGRVASRRRGIEAFMRRSCTGSRASEPSSTSKNQHHVRLLETADRGPPRLGGSSRSPAAGHDRLRATGRAGDDVDGRRRDHHPDRPPAVAEHAQAIRRPLQPGVGPADHGVDDAPPEAGGAEAVASPLVPWRAVPDGLRAFAFENAKRAEAPVAPPPVTAGGVDGLIPGRLAQRPPWGPGSGRLEARRSQACLT